VSGDVVKGHQDLNAGGHENCTLAATKTARFGECTDRVCRLRGQDLEVAASEFHVYIAIA